jgi:hypothetical protein
MINGKKWLRRGGGKRGPGDFVEMDDTRQYIGIP